VDVAEVLLMVGLGVVALMGRHVVLYVGAFIGLLLWGFTIADTDLTTGIAVCCAAGYFLYRVYDSWTGR